MRIHNGEKTVISVASPLAGPTALLNIKECILERHSKFVINDERPLSKIHSSDKLHRIHAGTSL